MSACISVEIDDLALMGSCAPIRQGPRETLKMTRGKIFSKRSKEALPTGLIHCPETLLGPSFKLWGSLSRLPLSLPGTQEGVPGGAQNSLTSTLKDIKIIDFNAYSGQIHQFQRVHRPKLAQWKSTLRETGIVLQIPCISIVFTILTYNSYQNSYSIIDYC